MPIDRHVREESAESGSIRQQDREVIEPECRASRRRTNARARLELDERAVAVPRREDHATVRETTGAQAEHVLVVRHRTVEIADEKANATDGRRCRQPEAGRNNSVCRLVRIDPHHASRSRHYMFRHWMFKHLIFQKNFSRRARREPPSADRSSGEAVCGRHGQAGFDGSGRSPGRAARGGPDPGG